MGSKRIKGGFSLIISMLGISGLFIGSMGMVAALPAPSQVYVSKKNCSDSGPGSNQVPYCTIQKGLDSVAAGGQVNVANGTYSELITFKKNKDNVTLNGSGNKTVIQPPANTAGTIVDVKDNGAVIENVNVSGPFTTNTCNGNEYGITLEKGSSATIQNNKISQIEESDPSLHGCQQGIAILVGDTKASADATIANNTISDYQKDGIAVDGANSNVSISNNNITGYGPTDVIAQNAIEVDNGTVSITNNVVKGNVYIPQTYASTGLLLFGPAQVTVNQNNVNQNDVGIYLVGIKNSGFGNNTVNNSTFNGIYADSSSKKNTFSQNTAHGTTPGAANFDVEDDSTGNGTLGTANTWTQNSCKTSSPAGLCKV